MTMKKQPLFPWIFRVFGLLLLVPSTIFFIACYNFEFQFSWLATGRGDSIDRTYNLSDEISVTLVIVSLLFIGFSKLRDEDEYIQHIRLRSLQWSVYAFYAIFLALTFLVYGSAYLYVVMYNVPTVLLLFNIIFYSNLYLRSHAQDSQLDEEHN
jgi:hypothetical protein